MLLNKNSSTGDEFKKNHGAYKYPLQGVNHNQQDIGDRHNSIKHTVSNSRGRFGGHEYSNHLSNHVTGIGKRAKSSLTMPN